MKSMGWTGSLVTCNSIPRKEELRKMLSAIIFIMGLQLRLISLTEPSSKPSYRGRYIYIFRQINASRFSGRYCRSKKHLMSIIPVV